MEELVRMKNWKYCILMLMTAFAVGSCSDDLEQDPQDVDFCVRAAWQDGLSGSKSTRALSATDILAEGTNDIVISTNDYPTTITVKCMKDAAQVGEDFTLTKGSGLCTEHTEYAYWQYTPSVNYKDKKIEREDYSFDFTATIDNGDELVGTANKYNIQGHHTLVTLHHTKALLRFAFKVSDKYDKVRYIRVTNINLNGANCELVDNVLTTSGQLIAYAYIDPTVVTTTFNNTLQCTYTIYDKDAVFPTPTMTEGEKTAAETELRNHLTREGVVAKNQFKLGSLKDKSSNPVTEIKAGYYYDLNVTLNPDYLYVMSEHDNKHITIE